MAFLISIDDIEYFDLNKISGITITGNAVSVFCEGSIEFSSHEFNNREDANRLAQYIASISRDRRMFSQTTLDELIKDSLTRYEQQKKERESYD